MTFVMENPDRAPDVLAIPAAIHDVVCAAGGLDPYRSTQLSNFEATTLCMRLRQVVLTEEAENVARMAQRMGVVAPFPAWFQERTAEFSQSMRVHDLRAVIAWIEGGDASAHLRVVGE